MFVLFACVLPDEKEDSGSPADDSGTSPVELLCEDPVEPACVDDMILDLSFQETKVSDGSIEEEADGDDFVALIDATAGGMSRASSNPALYVRFTPGGVEQVAVSDEDALEDMTWHLALKRYILRLNSGDGGPSCVQGAAVGRKAYDEIDALPDDVEWATEDFYDDECEMRTDALGGPETVMNGWWSYGSCVETTDTPYLLQLEDGSVLKVLVESYYAGEGQAECESEGSTNEDGGWISLRWRFL
jgi:hypothetical protein